MKKSNRLQFALMGYVAPCERANLRSYQRQDCDGFSGECHELYFIGLTVSVHVHDRADISRL